MASVAILTSRLAALLFHITIMLCLEPIVLDLDLFHPVEIYSIHLQMNSNMWNQLKIFISIDLQMEFSIETY